MRKYCIAVSGGCDSMTLLDQCIKKKMNIIVAHVNYQKRETAKRDENYVRDYCKKYHVPFFVRYCPTEYKGNFQDYAREYRYDFFRELCETEGCECVLVAHQQDDLFETYLMQCQRNSVPIYYGLSSEVKHHGITIRRPLLNMTKKECYEYCFKNEVPFGDDESNFSDDYLRNRIRKQISTWSVEQRNAILNEIQLRNCEKEEHQEKMKCLLDELGDDISIEKFLKLEDKENILRYWLYRNGVGYDISKRRLQLICETILKNEQNYQFDIDGVVLIKSYDVLQLVRNIEYSYTFDKIEEFDCEYFKIRKEGSSVEAVTLRKEDFPITIRSYKPNDVIQLRFGKKKINRFFIDRKISHKERQTYPIVVNSVGNVILVPKLGCDVEHYTVKPNCFVLK